MKANKEIIEYLKRLNKFKRVKIEGQNKERLVFENSQEVFNIYGHGKEVLNPFNDYTYEWLNSFLSNVIDLLNHNDFETYEELNESIQDNINEWADSETDVYTSGLTEWLNHNNSNVYYLEEAIKEYPEGDNHLMIAQCKAIEELFYNALNILIEDLKEEFPEVE